MSNCRAGWSTPASRSAPILCASVSCRCHGPTFGPANCRIMTPPMSTASKSAPRRRSRWGKRNERRPYFRIVVCPDADGHADLDFARPHRADLPVHDDAGADRERRTETVFRSRQFRHHGDSVLHPGRHLPDPRRGGAPDDCVHHLGGRAFAGRARPCRGRGLRDVRRDFGIQRRHRGRDRLDHDARHGQHGFSGSNRAPGVRIGLNQDAGMGQHGYPRRFGVGVISTSGALGILVPPSIILVLYGVSTNTSIGALFMAGIVPGLMLASMLAAVTWFIAWRKGYPRMRRATLREQWTAFRESVWGLLLIVIVLGGIYGGIFTPTEAAAVAAVYAFFITVFVYKELKFLEVGKVLLQAASMSSMLLYIITNAVLFSFLMTHEQIPQEMAAWIIDKNFSLWMFLLVVNILLLAAGNVMDPSSILLIMAPILFPLATKIGVHPVHLGVLMIVNTEVGLCHPPVGLNLYVGSGIAKMGISEITIAVLPWLFTMLIFLVMITYIPEISLWLPRLLGMI